MHLRHCTLQAFTASGLKFIPRGWDGGQQRPFRDSLSTLCTSNRTAGGLLMLSHTFIADGAESSPPPVTLIALIFTTWGKNQSREKCESIRYGTKHGDSICSTLCLACTEIFHPYIKPPNPLALATIHVRCPRIPLSGHAAAAASKESPFGGLLPEHPPRFSTRNTAA